MFNVPLVAGLDFYFFQAFAGGNGFIKCDDYVRMFYCFQVPLSYAVLNRVEYDQQLCSIRKFILEG